MLIFSDRVKLEITYRHWLKQFNYPDTTYCFIIFLCEKGLIKEDEVIKEVDGTDFTLDELIGINEPL